MVFEHTVGWIEGGGGVDSIHWIQVCVVCLPANSAHKARFLQILLQSWAAGKYIVSSKMLIEDLSTQIYYNLTVPLVCRMILHGCAR